MKVGGVTVESFGELPNEAAYRKSVAEGKPPLLFPVGYRAVRMGPAVDSTQLEVKFVSEIRRGVNGPLFVVTVEDQAGVEYVASSATGAWHDALTKRSPGKTIAVNGVAKFGLGLDKVTEEIKRLAGIDDKSEAPKPTPNEKVEEEKVKEKEPADKEKKSKTAKPGEARPAGTVPQPASARTCSACGMPNTPFCALTGKPHGSDVPPKTARVKKSQVGPTNDVVEAVHVSEGTKVAPTSKRARKPKGDPPKPTEAVEGVENVDTPVAPTSKRARKPKGDPAKPKTTPEAASQTDATVAPTSKAARKPAVDP